MVKDIKNNNYNHKQLVDWLEKKLVGKKIYKTLEESPEFQADVEEAKKKQEFFLYPRLSIDLIQVEKSELIDNGPTEKSNGEKKETFNCYTLFIAISSKTLFKDEETAKNKMINLKRRLLFYQFYLSRVSEPNRFQIIVIIPHYINITPGTLDFFKYYKFGLHKIDINKDKEEKIVDAENLRKRMIEKFNLSIDKPEILGKTIEKVFKKKEGKDISTFKIGIKENAVDFVDFFEKYIVEAIDAVAGVTPEDFGERYIDRELLNLMFKLKKVSYREKLSELVNEQLDENYDDYQFVSEVFSALWEEYIGIQYSKFLDTFEPALLHVFAEDEEKGDKYYRDHYIHQFQVFLLGLYIIDEFHDTFTKQKIKNPELNWLIISSFHDMAYPVQLYDEWSKRFFKEVFDVPVNLANIELKSNFVDQSFLSCMGYLICSLYKFHKKEDIKNNWIAEKNEIVQFFYQEITEVKNHCILSSMSFLKMVQATTFNDKNTIMKKISNNESSFNDILKDIFVPSALAIALHDCGIWKKLRKENNKDNPPRILDNLEFENDPLTFLLIFCDNIQEWGRPSISHEKKYKDKIREKEIKFYLKNIESHSEKRLLDITIKTHNYTKSERFFEDKQNELRSIQFFLKQSSDLKFTVHLRDKNDDGEDFTMQGISF